jgi:hypothetical protein
MQMTDPIPHSPGRQRGGGKRETGQGEYLLLAQLHGDEKGYK